MSDEATKFITQFHQLCGESVKEIQANSFKLFYSHTYLEKNQTDLAYISQHLNPTTHLERILQIDFFIYFRRFPELYKELLKGNDIVLCKLAKQKWFFIQAFAHLNCTEFVEELLPQVGYNVKLKLLKRLIVTEDKCDEIFEAVREKYGLSLALEVLTKCSSKKILEVLNAETIRLTARQFEAIHDKDSDLIRVYIEKRTKYEGSAVWLKNSPSYNYLALKNPKLFSEVIQKEEIVEKIGRKTSKRVLLAQKEKILENPELWIDILNASKLVKYLGEDYKELFFGGKKSICYWQSLLKHYPKKYQFEIYKTIHDKIHRYKFGENDETIPTEILEIIPENKLREEYAKIKYDKDANDDYLQYFTSTFCLQEVMNKLPHLKKWERQKYLNIATKSCILNKDPVGLIKLCELVARRLKNDGRSIRENFFEKLCEEESTLSFFTKEHWKLVMEIDAIIIAQEEFNTHCTEIRIRYVEFLMKNDAQNIKDVVKKFPIDWFDNIYWTFLHYKQTGKVIQHMINILIEHGHPKPPKEGNAAAIYDCELVDKVKQFNEKFPKHVIKNFDNERIRKSIFQMMQAENLDDNTWSSSQGILYMVCQKNKTDIEKLTHKLFFDNIKKSGALEHCLWFAKHRPKTLELYFQAFLDNYANFYKSKSIVTAFWKTIKKCSHCKLAETAEAYCKDNIKSESYEDKKHLNHALLLISDPIVATNFIESNYMPVSSSVDLTDQSAKDLYAIQSEFIKRLHYLSAPEAIISMTFNCCKGDYLKHALHPLYSCCYRLPEKDILNIVDQLSKTKAVSTRKHSLYLSCAVLPQKTVVFYLKETSVSSLASAAKYFNNNPSPALWTIVEKKIATVEKQDIEALKYLFDKPLPALYNAKLFECVWTIWNKYENVIFRKYLFEKSDKPLVFNSTFLEQLLEDCLLKADYANVFLANLLVDLDENKKFEAIKKTFMNLKTAKQKIKLFIKSLFDVYMERKQANDTFATKFSVVYNELFDPHEAFEEFVLVNVMTLKDQTIEKAANILLTMFKNFRQIYGIPTTLLLAEFIYNTVFAKIFETDDQIYELCYNLSKKVPNLKDDLLWIVKLLPNCVPKFQKTFIFYSHLRNTLIELNDPGTKLVFNWKLMSNSSNINFDQEIVL